MMQWLVSVPMLVGASIAGIGSILLGLSTYFVSRATIGNRADDKSADLALHLFRVLATLLSLLISLTFADVNDEIRKVRQAVDLETAQLGNVFRNLLAFETAEAASIKDSLLEYVDLVVEAEWATLQQGEVSRETVEKFGEIKMEIFNLRPSGTQQEILHMRLIEDISSINETRAGRLIHRGVFGAPLFFYVAIFGFIWTVALLSVYSPGKGRIVFISLYCAFIGVIIYLTLGLTYNFIGFGAVSPEPFQYLATLIRTL